MTQRDLFDSGGGVPCRASGAARKSRDLKRRPPPQAWHTAKVAEPRTSAAARDATLRRHQSRHAILISVALTYAVRLAHEQGSVTSTQVLAAMRAAGWGDELDVGNGRWLGAVLLPRNGFERTGEFERTGSNARPVPRWRWRGE